MEDILYLRRLRLDHTQTVLLTQEPLFLLSSRIRTSWSNMVETTITAGQRLWAAKRLLGGYFPMAEVYEYVNGNGMFIHWEIRLGETLLRLGLSLTGTVRYEINYSRSFDLCDNNSRLTDHAIDERFDAGLDTADINLSG